MKPENAVTVLLTVWLIVFFAIAKCVPNAAGAFFGSIIWTLAVVIYALVSDYIEDIKESVHKQAKAVYRAQMEFLKYEEEKEDG
jgi:phage-related holin